MENLRRELRMEKEVFDSIVERNYGSVCSTHESDMLGRGKTYMSNNMLHIAVRYRRNTIAVEIRNRYPHLTWERNVDGNTPFHVAAEMGNQVFVRQVCDELNKDMRPLRMKNSLGNTPLHVAIIHRKLDVAVTLVEKDPYLATIVNASMEAPLHLFVRHYPDEDYYPGSKDEAFYEAQAWLDSDCDDDHFYSDDDGGDFDENREITTSDLLIGGRSDRVVESPFDNETMIRQMQNMGDLLRLLLGGDNEVACWRDASGLTPLHIAASLNTTCNLDVIKSIISSCPSSIEVCDSFGKNILHHLINRIVYQNEGSEFFEDPRLRGLVNQQDHHGNTPLVLAVMNNDVVMSELLKSKGGNLFIKNKIGHNAATLIRQSNILKMMEKGKIMTKEECDAAKHGDVFFLNTRRRWDVGEKYFSSVRDSDGKNHLHKLFLIKWGNLIIPDQFLRFIEDIIHVDMMNQTDRNGDTPLHILARLEPENIKINVATGGGLHTDNTLSEAEYLEIGKQLRALSSNYERYGEKPYVLFTYGLTYLGSTNLLSSLIELCATKLLQAPSSTHCPPLLVQNAKGNTPLHEAIIAKNYHILIKLLELCRASTALLNKRNETVLHLLASLNPTPTIPVEVLNDIIRNNTRDERYFRDENGLTPLMRAIRGGNIAFAERLVSFCPKLAELMDTNGQTCWHMLVNVPTTIVSFENEPSSSSEVVAVVSSFNVANTSFTTQGVLRLLDKKDNEGKTALHLAVENRRFDLAELFLGLHGTLAPDGKPYFLKHLLKIPNSDGITPGELIGELPYVPKEFEDFVGKVSTMIGIRSIWGIPSTQIKDYVNTMGVIAALLTTITFTAAFTVPGGLDQEKGTPLFIKDKAFQIFIISDIIAMCLSMMVLFCLLWIMATGNKGKTVVLLDFSIILLLASFYTTLVTFMTGLYATTYFVKPWVAIVALVMCSTLLLLMQKFLVMKFIIPIGKVVLTLFDKALHFVRNMRKKLGRRIERCLGHTPRSHLPVSSC